MTRKRKPNLIKKFIYYSEKYVFAICYPSDKVIYYNLNFVGKHKIVFMIPANEPEDKSIKQI